ncbi:MAG: cob(I)yrinic acid a,c-diamide adenosyltransferase [Dehalococcoidia bacterium]|nr:cob(I)yrinic acid a,c-diamide adenosyltransferase [Dehalococcoidia bacterium]
MDSEGFCAAGHPIGKGYVQVYTGNSKGKTTAALGLAFRAMGHGLKTYIGQFVKKHPYGEVQASCMSQGCITVEQYGLGCFIYAGNMPSDEDFSAAVKGMVTATEVIQSGKYNIVVMDEILTACHLKLISQRDILSLISGKPDGLELILTGRNATEEIINAADLVTEMKEIKHYYCRGVPAREGIEY